MGKFKPITSSASITSELEKVQLEQLKFRKWFKYGLKALKLIQTTRPERAEAPSPGQRPGLFWTQICRPVRAKALKLQGQFVKLLPLQGALLIAFIPRALPWAKSFCPFRACCVLQTVWVDKIPFYLHLYQRFESFLTHALQQGGFIPAQKTAAPLLA